MSSAPEKGRSCNRCKFFIRLPPSPSFPSFSLWSQLSSYDSHAEDGYPADAYPADPSVFVLGKYFDYDTFVVLVSIVGGCAIVSFGFLLYFPFGCNTCPS